MIRCFIYKKLSLAFLFTILSLSRNPFYGQINEKYHISNEVWQSYKLKNAKETRLLEFKDNDEQLLAKLVLLNLINKHRKKHHKQLVELDIHACRSANKTAQEPAHNLSGASPTPWKCIFAGLPAQPTAERYPPAPCQLPEAHQSSLSPVL